MHRHALVYSQVQKDTEHSSIFLENYTHSKSHLCCSGGGKLGFWNSTAGADSLLNLSFPPATFYPKVTWDFFFSNTVLEVSSLKKKKKTFFPIPFKISPLKSKNKNKKKILNYNFLQFLLFSFIF